MPSGGSRPGAGRKPLEATKLRQALIKIAEKNADKLSKVLYDKAMQGDLPSIKEVIDRGIGKAIQPIAGSDGGNLIVEHHIIQPEEKRDIEKVLGTGE